MSQDESQLAGAADQAIAVSKRPVLQLSQVTFRSRSESGVRLQRADLQLREGEVALVHLDPATSTRELASMLQGLAIPSEGEVRFDGEDWRGEDYDRHFRMRSRIGRVFEGQAWIENLNVDENVTLGRRHHGDDAASIGADVQHWLALLQVNGLSRKRPAFVEPSVLQVHQWIRAFLGSPVLVILERPLQFLSSSWRPRLVEAIARLRARKTAVLWFTSLPVDSLEIPMESLQRWSLQDGRFRAFDGGSTS